MIPDDAVEVAAKAIHRYDVREGIASTYAPNKHHRAEARAMLEAVAPLIAAQALREAADHIDGVKVSGTAVVSAKWLRTRAEEMNR